MKIKTSELEGEALNWAYAYATEQPIYIRHDIPEPVFESREDAKRYFVAVKLGDEVEIPEELLMTYNDLDELI